MAFECYGSARSFAAWAALVALAAGCGEGSSGGAPAAASGADPETDAGAAVPDRSEMRIAVVSHGQSSDPFWSVVANGIDDGAREMGIEVDYQAPTQFDMVRMSQLIDAAVASRPDGLVVTIPDGDALGPSIRAAVAAGIPVLSINSGDDVYEELGVLAHIGQTEYLAGLRGGERLAEAGVEHGLCVNHEVGNLSLDLRCRGFADALAEAGGRTEVLAVDLANPADAEQRVAGALASDPSLDGILTLGPVGAGSTLAALEGNGRLGGIPFGTFDLSVPVLRAVGAGDMLFAIDQQPYLQGYLAVVLMTKYLETGLLPGGGDVVLTGPAFVTAETAGEVIDLVERGVR